MSAPEEFGQRPSRVRFVGSESGTAHTLWYRLIADHYDAMYRSGFAGPGEGGADRAKGAAECLHDVFHRYGPMRNVLDVACGTFSIDLELLERGYEVVGCDFSSPMLAVARRRLQEAGREATVFRADMKDLDLGRTFDAVLCLGTAFNYLHAAGDWQRALDRFRAHLRGDGLLILDLTNFAAWIDDPTNVRAEADYRAPDGTRVAVFGFNEQNAAKTQHLARYLTVVQRGDAIDIAFDEAVLKVWHPDSLTEALEAHGFRAVEWWGELRRGVRYVRSERPRMVCVALAGEPAGSE